jgi:lipopolysaccharide transport system permease protein
MSATAQRDSVNVVSIRPSEGWLSLDLGEIWRRRELLYFLIWRDVKVRYKQTLLGVTWAVLQPVFTLLIFTIFFGRLAKMPSDGIPYPLFAFAALVPWQLFANGLTQASNSLVNNSNLITKIYFPRPLIPLAAVLAGLVDFLVGMVLLIGMMYYYQVHLQASVVYLPIFLLLCLVTCLGAGLWTAALQVAYRDIRHVLPFAVQMWMFATPIAYPSSLLREPWRTVYALNPMVGVVEGFRAALLGAHTGSGTAVIASAVVACVILISGAYYFRRVERAFADII